MFYLTVNYSVKRDNSSVIISPNSYWPFDTIVPNRNSGTAALCSGSKVCGTSLQKLYGKMRVHGLHKEPGLLNTIYIVIDTVLCLQAVVVYDL